MTTKHWIALAIAAVAVVLIVQGLRIDPAPKTPEAGPASMSAPATVSRAAADTAATEAASAPAADWSPEGSLLIPATPNAGTRGPDGAPSLERDNAARIDRTVEAVFSNSNKIEALTLALETMLSRVDATSDRLDETIRMVGETQRRLAGVELQFSNLQGQLDTLRHQTHRNTAAIEARDQEIGKLRDALTESGDRVERTAAELVVIGRRLGQLGERVESARSQVGANTDLINARAKKVEELANEVRTLLGRLGPHLETLEAETSQFGALASKVTLLEQQLNRGTR